MKDNLINAVTSENPADAARDIYQDYPTLAAMDGFDQENIHHSMSLLDHSLSTLDYVSGYTDKPEVRVAALYHDAGKPATKVVNPETGNASYHGHDQMGAELARNELSQIGFEPEFVDDVSSLINNHMRPLGYINQPFKDKGVRRLISKTEGNNVNVDDLMHLNRADIQAHTPEQVEETLEGHYRLQNHIDKVRSAT
jgi:putative nucleotidyltransferase with HDIG domain